MSFFDSEFRVPGSVGCREAIRSFLTTEVLFPGEQSDLSVKVVSKLSHVRVPTCCQWSPMGEMTFYEMFIRKLKVNWTSQYHL